MNSRTRPTVSRQTGVGRSTAGTTGGSSRQSPSVSSPVNRLGFGDTPRPKRPGGPASGQATRQGGPPPSSGRAQGSQANSSTGAGNFYEDEDAGSSQRFLGSPGVPISRSSPHGQSSEKALAVNAEDRGLFSVIEHLAALEAALYSILDGLKANATYVSFFCREYWGTSAGQAQLCLEKVSWSERLKRQVQQACVLESLSLGVASHLCSGTMQDVSLTILSRLRNLLYYIHENVLVLMDLVCQRWLQENPQGNLEAEKAGHCPENLNLDILLRTGRYRQLRKGEHVMALRQHNEMIANVVRQLCRGAALRRPPSSRTRGATSPSPGDRSPGLRSGSSRTSGSTSSKALQSNVLAVVNEVLAARTPLDRLKASTIRSRMLQYLCFRPLLNDANDPDCLWPATDPYNRYGADTFSVDGPIIWFEPLPPMLCNLKENPKLPPVASNDVYTLVLDLDETLVHYFEHNGMGNYGIRPGMHEFLERMHAAGYELVIFTAATQDYADWVIDQIDPERLIHHRLYRQHALPWGPLFAKDLSRLGRDLDRTLIIDNVQENFMLQPDNGIYILTWYDDPHDTALFTLTPLLEELVQTRARVPDILDKYRDQIPTWAGFDQFGGGEFEDGDDDGYAAAPPPQQLPPQQDFQPAPRNELRQQSPAAAMYAQPRAAEAPQHAATHQPQQTQQQLPPQYEAASQYGTGYSAQAAATSQPQQYLQQRGGYQQQAAAAPQRAQAPREAMAPQLKAPAPTFSKVSGAYQAPLPQAQPPRQPQAQPPHAAQTQMAQGLRPVNAAVYGRPGLGAQQYVPTRQ